MKTLYFLLFTTTVYAQVDPYFLTKITFRDAIGNTKIIELGYDTLASRCDENTQFGCKIDSSIFDSVFDVRVQSFFNNTEGGFCRKMKLIFSKRFVGGASRIRSRNFCISSSQTIFFIHAKYQPITITWESDDFEKINCKDANWSFFTPEFVHNLINPLDWVKIKPPYACILKESYTLHLDKRNLDSLKVVYPYFLQHEIEGRGMDTIYGVGLVHDHTFFYCDKSFIDDVENEVGSGKSGFSLYPNPAYNFMTIQSPWENDILQVRVYTTQGVLVKTDMLTYSAREVDVSTLASGIYYAELISHNGRRAVRSFVKW